jgi:hypothetical protein
MPLGPTEGNGGGLSTLQFVAGIDRRVANVLSVPTPLISVPIAEVLWVYTATLYDGWCSWREEALRQALHEALPPQQG